MSQRTSFETTRKELNFMERRKKVLDDMFTTGKITQATYEYLSKDLNEAIKDLKTRQKTSYKAEIPANDIESQLKTQDQNAVNLETYLLNKITNKNKEITNTSKDALPPPPPTIVKSNELLKTPKERKQKTKKRKKKARKTRKAKKSNLKTAKILKYCSNPWNGKCENINTEVIIYYDNKMLPICRDCWYEIVNKNITW